MPDSPSALRLFAYRRKKATLKAMQRAKHTLNYIRYRQQYKFPVIYIAACPKTASTWVSHLIADLLPGYGFYYPRAHAGGQKGTDFDITEDVLKDLRRKRVVVRSHTPPKERNIQNMNASFGKYMALVRDPRDVIVSTYHHIHRSPGSSFVERGLHRDLPWETVPSEVLDLDKEACLDILIEKLLPGLLDLSYGWFKHAQENEQVLLLSFREITQHTVDELTRIMQFYEIPLSKEDIQARTSRFNAQQGGGHGFRKGKVNNWRNELTSDQHQRCLEIAGSRIEEMGYELLYHG